MNLRPAGMSDEDNYTEDSEDFVFLARTNCLEDLYSYNKEHCVQIAEDQRMFETYAIKACLKGDLDVIEEYLEKNDVNKFTCTGWSLLLYATSSVQLEIIEYLLEHGADPNRDKDGFTPLMALCNSTKELPEISLKCLLLLIGAKADVNARNKQRETALMYACKSQNVDLVTELLRHVEDINGRDSDGKTALSYAATYNKPDTVRVLLEHNADATLPDKHNLTPKDIADTKDFQEISALLTVEEEISYCEISQLITWRDIFPEIYPKSKELLDHDVSYILYGMGLEKRYGTLFRGMDLKTFLQLTEDDLHHLGIHISVYREEFLEKLHEFHCKRWKVNSLGIAEKSLLYTIYDGVMSLANIKNQISVITSSFQYMKNNLMQCAKEDIHFDPAERVKYEVELRKTQNTLKILKYEANHCKKLAQEIDKKNGIGVPANFISSPRKCRNRTNWVISLGVTLMIGLYIYKTAYIHRS